MSNEANKKEILPNENPREAEPGRGAPGNEHDAVQMAQTTAVNPPDERIPSGLNAQKSKEELKAFEEQEEGTGLHTTGGYSITESGKLNNVAVEPEMYVEDENK